MTHPIPRRPTPMTDVSRQTDGGWVAEMTLLHNKHAHAKREHPTPLRPNAHACPSGVSRLGSPRNNPSPGKMMYLSLAERGQLPTR